MNDDSIKILCLDLISSGISSNSGDAYIAFEGRVYDVSMSFHRKKAFIKSCIVPVTI